MRLPETELEYMRSLADAAELGAKRALQEAGLLKPYLKKQEARRLYGPAVVDRWIREGLVRVIKDGDSSSNNRISRTEIEAVAKTANRITYLTTKERQSLAEL